MSGIQQAVISTFISSGPPPIGSPFKGGYYGGLISTAANGIADFYLIVAPRASGQATFIRYRLTDDPDSGVDSVINGNTNTANIPNSSTYPAFQFVKGLSIGGYTDWYIPAIQELEVLYFNFKPGTTINVTTTGANPYAVPPRASNYTTGTPSQTSVATYQTGGSEAFDQFNWASTQFPTNTDRAWVKNFNDGAASGSDKNNFFTVRAVRREPIPT